MVDDVYNAMLMDSPIKYRFVIWILFALLISFLLWSSLSSLEQVTRGEGKVIPSSQLQIIQSLDGGILEEMYVKEGMLVDEGQPLARIDDTRFRSDAAQQKVESDSMRANIIRLQAELNTLTLSPVSNQWRNQISLKRIGLDYPEALVQRKPELVKRQKREYDDRINDLENRLNILSHQVDQRQLDMKELNSKLATLRSNYSLIKRELDLTRPLAQQGVVPEVELLKLERQVNSLVGEIESIKDSQNKVKAAQAEAILKRREVALAFNSEVRSELNKTQSLLARLDQAQLGTQDKVDKAVITSPVKGTIKTIHINTQGGVVRPGNDLIEIVPAEDQLLIEAKILPKDIAFLYPGLPAVVKVTAYDFTRYGGLDGILEHISADTTQDDKGNSFYLVRIRTNESSLIKKNGQSLPIIPGMLTSVDIITGKRTVMEYILNPILRARENALRER
ncbi:HlyD family type I secretion periplasmic adaptor subunit [Veronia pacifica]|uniref:Membrane fusion protein (MFP) family protein n=1 Tax=Veronia pacifica TaxID=1080227 RepID=A0A1C3E7K4_9GAMM|nr:HlyD family type I secretion periplasmic adaptor subunit [Veronia pacifica]ODA29222.1 hemolysin secretion protein D [Veronia pacifica]